MCPFRLQNLTVCDDIGLKCLYVLLFHSKEKMDGIVIHQ